MQETRYGFCHRKSKEGVLYAGIAGDEIESGVFQAGSSEFAFGGR